MNHVPASPRPFLMVHNRSARWAAKLCVQPPVRIRPPRCRPAAVQPIRPAVAAPPPLTARPVAAAPVAAQPINDDPIALEDDADADGLEEVDIAPSAPKKITFGPEIGHRKHNWTRQTRCDGTGACRMRSFHGKLSEQGLEYLDDAINVWLDQHPEIEVKFVTSNIGMFDGKMKDLAVILQVWY